MVNSPSEDGDLHLSQVVTLNVNGKEQSPLKTGHFKSREEDTLHPGLSVEIEAGYTELPLKSRNDVISNARDSAALSSAQAR